MSEAVDFYAAQDDLASTAVGTALVPLDIIVNPSRADEYPKGQSDHMCNVSTLLVISPGIGTEDGHWDVSLTLGTRGLPWSIGTECTEGAAEGVTIQQGAQVGPHCASYQNFGEVKNHCSGFGVGVNPLSVQVSP